MNVNVPNGNALTNAAQPMEWPDGALTRVPFWIYQSPEIYALEQKRIYEGPVWNYLCLEAEVASPATTAPPSSASMPVVVARDYDERDLRIREPLRAPRGADRAR